EEYWVYINCTLFLVLIIYKIYCIKYYIVMEKNLNKLIFISSLFSFIVTILFGITSIPIIALLISLVIGISEQVRTIPLQTIIQTSVPKKELPTVYTSLGDRKSVV